jgi:transcriptional regulator with XRE-family HTH domain
VRLKQQAVGDLVKRIRQERGLTLRALAGATDFSPSFISQLENGLVSPSIGSMEKIANTLGLTLGDFFGQLGSSEGGVIVRPNDRVQLPSEWSQGTVEALSPMSRGRLLEPLLVTLLPGGRTGKHPSAPRAKPREEFALVLEGEVELTLGPESYVLNEGDSVTILRGELRRWTNKSPRPVRVLIIASS